MRTLREIVQEAAGALNQPAPVAVANNNLGDAALWFNLAQREGRELARRHDWQGLMVGASVAALGANLQTALPSDFDRFTSGTRLLNSTLDRSYVGPVSPAEWQSLFYLGPNVSPGAFRLVGGSLYITPAPTAGDTIVYEYISKNFCESSTGTAQSAWADDSDVPILPDDLISLGITWRWLRAKGMSYAEEMSTYEREVEKAASRDRGQNNIMVVGGAQQDEVLLSSTWNGTITP
jgi:hypothetical protein